MTYKNVYKVVEWSKNYNLGNVIVTEYEYALSHLNIDYKFTMTILIPIIKRNAAL